MEKVDSDSKPLYSTSLRGHNWRYLGFWWRVRCLWWEKIVRPIFYVYDSERQLYIKRIKLKDNK